MSKFFHRKGLSLLIITFLAMQLWAYDDFEIKMRRAENFEKINHYDRAIFIYEKLRDTVGNKPPLFTKLFQAYLKNNQAEQALELITLWQSKYQLSEDEFLFKKIEVLLAQGKTDEILPLQTQLTQHYQRQEQWASLAGLLAQYAQLDKAEELYLQARTKSQTDHAYAEELAQIYAANNQPEKALREWVRLYVHTPQKRYIAQRNLNYLLENEPERIEHLETEIRSYKDPNLKRLLAKQLLLLKKFDQAWDVTLELNNMHDFQRLAEAAETDHAFDIAEQAYQQARAKSQKYSDDYWKFSLQIIRLAYSQQRYDVALAETDHLLQEKKLPRQFQNQTLLLRGKILQKMQRLSEAEESYQRAIAAANDGRQKNLAHRELAKLAFAQEKWEKAEEQLRQAQLFSHTEEDQAQSLLLQAHYSILRGQFTQAKTMSDSLFNTYPANLVWTENAFLRELLQTVPAPLQEAWSHSLLALYQEQSQRVVAIWQDAAVEQPEGWLLKGILLQQAQQDSLAMACFDTLATQFPESRQAPYALFQIIAIASQTNDLKTARYALEALLSDHADSVAMALARNQFRHILDMKDLQF